MSCKELAYLEVTCCMYIDFMIMFCVKLKNNNEKFFFFGAGVFRGTRSKKRRSFPDVVMKS